jgi:hypothetical protein
VSPRTRRVVVKGGQTREAGDGNVVRKRDQRWTSMPRDAAFKSSPATAVTHFVGLRVKAALAHGFADSRVAILRHPLRNSGTRNSYLMMRDPSNPVSKRVLTPRGVEIYSF